MTYQDEVFTVLPGLAHLSNRPFGKRGFWGRPWRSSREFVGKVNYGVRWRMWSPAKHADFPVGFQKAAETLLMASRRPESLVYLLQDEIVFFIMNKCMWDCWGRTMSREKQLEAPQLQQQEPHGGRFGHGGMRMARFGGGGWMTGDLWRSLLTPQAGQSLLTAAGAAAESDGSDDENEYDDEYEEYESTEESEEESAESDEGEEEGESENESEDEEKAAADKGAEAPHHCPCAAEEAVAATITSAVIDGALGQVHAASAVAADLD